MTANKAKQDEHKYTASFQHFWHIARNSKNNNNNNTNKNL